MKTLRTLLGLAVVVAVVAAAAVWFGAYNVAADVPHWNATQRVLELARDRSIAAHAARIEVPDLTDPALIRSGAGNYNAMCVACHLSPDAQETELSIGLYPRPPRWDALGSIDPREAFWVVKHGIKASGMPAWGRSMDDEYLWGLVAFMQQFASMTAAQYSAQVAASPGHSHGGGESGIATGEPHSSPGDAASAPIEQAGQPKPQPSESEPEHEHAPDAPPHRH